MAQKMLASAAEIIAQEIKVTISQVTAAIRLLDEGATVPFIARYRKEATQGLTDTQLRHLVERLHYLRELDERRAVVLESIRQQEKLTAELEQAILAADSKARLEDLYLPYRPKRHTKAHMAKEAGLEPLALALWQDPSLDLKSQAAAFINAEAGIMDEKAALEGAGTILMERFVEEAPLLEVLREELWQQAVLKSVGKKDKKGKKIADNKFADYIDYTEPLKKIPSHRALALFRGRRENALQLSLSIAEEDYGEKKILAYFRIGEQKTATSEWLHEIVRTAWKVKLFTKLELELFTHLREAADEEAIQVFARNLRDLLLAAPAGPRVIMGLDPGIRTGVKTAVVDKTGKLLNYTTIFPFAPQNEWYQAIAELAKFAAKYQVDLISIGNGTGSRETERLVGDMMKQYPDLALTKVVVSEAGASVYSASELAAKEFSELDVSLRGAVSIARRLQDPLAELVKIEPKAIGVGQYQHDVNQGRLARSLNAVVEDCVNAVGVDVNTASFSLLAHVSGLNESLAQNVVKYRDEQGAFNNREQLKNVPRMGEKTFQQAAGFLRIRNGTNFLDASAVHPEAYPLVEKILADQKITIEQLIGNRDIIRSIKPEYYIDEQYGLPTIRDVLLELEKPGRDPRPQFKTVVFKEGIEAINDLEEGMILEGVVSNVTNFGAFVDIGVHQDGLVHISEMTHRFIHDPHALVKAGDIIQVKVTKVDKDRRRISLSMKKDEETNKNEKRAHVKKQEAWQKKRSPNNKQAINKVTNKTNKTPNKKPLVNTAMADAFAKLRRSPE